MKHKISWTGKTWNPITGCTKIAQGCSRCYAETMFNRLSKMDFKGNIYKGRKFTDVQIHPERLDEPYKWKKPCMVFVNSMADLFHERVPFEFIEKVYDTMFDNGAVNTKHTFQILTKRPGRALEFYKTVNQFRRFDYSNIWLGVSVSTQADADKNIPILLETPAAVRWVSIEPMLEFVDIEKPTPFGCYPDILDWVVIGCESGHGKRECKIEWIESIVNQCKMAGVPVFVKQLNIGGNVEKDIAKFPKHLQIRQFPKIKQQ